jgi:periplasmic protein CpxP/Spy
MAKHPSHHKEEHMKSTESTSQNTRSRKRIWWLVAGLTVALAGGLGAHAYAFGGDGFPGFHGMGNHKEFMQRRMEKMLDEVKATEAQRTAIKNIAARLQTEMEPIHKQHDSLHQQIVQAFAADKIDGVAIEKLRTQTTALVEQGSQILTRALVDAANVLSVDQRQTVIKHLQEHHGRMMHGPR